MVLLSTSEPEMTDLFRPFNSSMQCEGINLEPMSRRKLLKFKQRLNIEGIEQKAFATLVLDNLGRISLRTISTNF